MISVESVLTPGEIARRLGEPQHRVVHILNTRAHIRPVRRVGIVRTYAAPEVVELVRAELNAIDARRSRRVEETAERRSRNPCRPRVAAAAARGDGTSR